LVAHTASVPSLHRTEALAAGCADFITKPFDDQQIYECLERLLGVRFERATPAAEMAEGAGSPGHVQLPEELCARLMVAAELHSTTALKACLQELRQADPDTRRLADEIRRLMRSYDMDGIQSLITHWVHPADSKPVPNSPVPP